MRTAEKVWRSKVKKIQFAECQKMTLGKGLTTAALCRVFQFAECPTLGKPGLCRVLLFAECSALSKPPLCRVPVVCRVLSLWHSTNSLFAERPIKSTRQSMGHSAKKPSLVVQSIYIYILSSSVPNFKSFRPFRYIVFTTNLDITHARLSTLQELIKFLVKLKRLNYKLDRGST